MAGRVSALDMRFYDYGMSGLMMTFQANPKHLLGSDSEITSVKTSVKTPMRILELLEANPRMTLAEVAANIGKTLRAVELASSKLVKEGRLKHIGPQKGGYWEITK